STAWLLGALAALALGIVFVVLGAGLWPRRWQRQAWTLAGALALALFQGARLVSYYFQGEGFNERFFFHLSADSLQAAGAYWPLATAVAALLLAVALAALLLAPPHRRAPRRALLGGLALTACLLLDPALRRTFSAARVAAMAP